MTEMNPKRKKLIFLLVAVSLMFALTLFAVIYYIKTRGGINVSGVLRADTFYYIVAFAVLIPVLLIVLLALMLVSKFSKKAEKAEVDINSPIVVNVGKKKREKRQRRAAKDFACYAR